MFVKASMTRIIMLMCCWICLLRLI